MTQNCNSACTACFYLVRKISLYMKMCNTYKHETPIGFIDRWKNTLLLHCECNMIMNYIVLKSSVSLKHCIIVSLKHCIIEKDCIMKNIVVLNFDSVIYIIMDVYIICKLFLRGARKAILKSFYSLFNFTNSFDSSHFFVPMSWNLSLIQVTHGNFLAIIGSM